MKERGRDPGSYAVATAGRTRGGDPLAPGQLPQWRYTLRYSEVLLSPGGKHIVAMAPVPGPDKGWAEPGLTLLVHRIDTGKTKVVPDVRDARRINFAPDGSAAYVLGSDGRSLFRVDLDTAKAKKIQVLDEPFRVLDVSPGGRYLIAGNLPKSDREEWFFDDDVCVQPAARSGKEQESACNLAIVDLESGQAHKVVHDLPVRDLDFSPAHDELVLTSSFWPWDSDSPVATLTFLRLPDGEQVERVEFPNCADELVVQPEGTLALLSPTNCSTVVRPPTVEAPKEKKPKAPPPRRDYDPISVLDLASRTFIRNLPGFGPVEMADDGRRAVGFTRRADMAKAWSYQQREAVGMIIVHLPSLRWYIIEHGAYEPTYFLGPEGRWLYTSGHHLSCRSRDGSIQRDCETFSDPTRLFDLHNAVLRKEVRGQPFDFSHFATADDGRTLYSLGDRGLVKLELGDSHTSLIPLDVRPELVSGSQERLVLGEEDAPVFYLFDLEPGSELQTLDLGDALSR